VQRDVLGFLLRALDQFGPSRLRFLCLPCLHRVLPSAVLPHLGLKAEPVRRRANFLHAPLAGQHLVGEGDQSSPFQRIDISFDRVAVPFSRAEISVIEPGLSLTARKTARRAAVTSCIMSAGSSKLTMRSSGSFSPRSALLASRRPRRKKSPVPGRC
jgi:hypothetical protein